MWCPYKDTDVGICVFMKHSIVLLYFNLLYRHLLFSLVMRWKGIYVTFLLWFSFAYCMSLLMLFTSRSSKSPSSLMMQTRDPDIFFFSLAH